MGFIFSWKGFFQQCVNNECIAAPECLNTSDCPRGFDCVLGVCRFNPQCNSDDDCEEGEICSGNRCIPFLACISTQNQFSKQ